MGLQRRLISRGRRLGIRHLAYLGCNRGAAKQQPLYIKKTGAILYINV